jgi:hypothetical protein
MSIIPANKSAALLIGLNYPGSSCALNGCINDVKNVGAFLRDTLGFRQISTYDDVSTPLRTTGAGIMQSMRELVARSWEQGLEAVWIHYSGHGTSVRDAGSEELDGKDECICPSDYDTAGLISDDMIGDILRGFNPATKVVCIFDCCHSGTIADLRWRYMDRRVRSQENVRPETGRIAKTLMMSGCMDNQTSADAFGAGAAREYSGALTTALLGSLKDRPALRGDVLGLVEDVRDRLRRGRFAQVPQLCSSYELNADAEPLLL